MRGVARGRIAALAIASLALCIPGCGARGAADGAALAQYLDAAAAYDSGQADMALPLAQKALDLDKGFVPALVLAGKSAFFQSMPAQASSFLEEAMRLRPSGTEARLWLARVRRFDGDGKAARSLCESVLADDGSNLAALRLLASVAGDSGEPERSLALLNRAVEAASEAGLAFLDRAALRWAMGDREGTARDLAAALAVLPEGSAYGKSALRLLETVGGEAP